MSYRVFWSPHADETLGKILNDAADHARVARAVKTIDRRLVNVPFKFGESRSGNNLRVAFVRPIAVYFEVLEDVQTVIVHGVWRADRK